MTSTPEELRRREMRARAERYISSCSEYTSASEREQLIHDWVKKGDVATRVVRDFSERVGNPRDARVLDIGFGNGLYAAAFAKAGAQVSGLEVNEVLLQIASENLHEEDVSADLQIYDGMNFPFADNSFDYAFSVSVIEHVSDARRFLTETSRTLKPGGKFYLAFPNRFRPREAHTGILFLGYLPRSVAQYLLRRISKRNTVEEINLHFISYWKLKRLLRGTSLRIHFDFTSTSPTRRILKRMLASIGIQHSAILGTVMVILEKRA